MKQLKPYASQQGYVSKKPVAIFPSQRVSFVWIFPCKLQGYRMNKIISFRKVGRWHWLQNQLRRLARIR
jgi:hypothetical protein